MKEKIKEFMKRIIFFIRHKGLQFTLLVSFSLVAVGMIIVVTFAYTKRLSSIHKEMVETKNSATIEQIVLSFDQRIQDIMQVANLSYYDVLKDKDLQEEKKSIAKTFDLLIQTHEPQITNIAVFDSHGKPLVVSPKTSPFRKEMSVSKENWYLNGMAQIENMHIVPPEVDHLFKHENHEYPRVITFSRSIELNQKGVISQGVLLVNMNFSAAARIFMQGTKGDVGSLFLADEKGKVIYHPQQLLLNENWLQIPKNIGKMQDGVYQEEGKKDAKVTTIQTMGYTGWKLVQIEPVEKVTSVFTDNRVFIWTLAGLACASLLVINMVISSRITIPLRHLEKAVTKIEENFDDFKIPEEGTFEIRHLSHALMTMTDTMRRLMKDVVRQQEKMRENELAVLQAQINPHFLYNTLDSTVWMIESEHYKDAIAMITALAKFFRISLSKGKKVITLGEELEQVRSYLTIQEYRYKNKFIANITVEEGLEKKACLKLIIQPIVENAIYHGMDYMVDDGVINIRVKRLNGNICIEVQDNGPGMTAEQVDALMKGKLKSKKGSNVGFQNVVERIRLHYGLEYGVKVFSEPDEGTTVQMLIPNEEAVK